MNVPHILFVTNRWTGNHDFLGDSSACQDYFNTLLSTKLATFSVFNYDAYSRAIGTYQYHLTQEVIPVFQGIDPGLMDAIIVCNPDVIFMLNVYDVFVTFSDEVYEYIKKILNIPVVFLYGDSSTTPEYNNSKADFCIHVDSDTMLDRTGVPTIFTLECRDTNIYNDPGLDRDIDVLHNGSLHKHRTDILQVLESAGIHVEKRGGFPGKISNVDYASYYKKAKMTLSIAGNTVSVNGHLFEGMYCGSCVFQSYSNTARKTFTPGVHYVEFTTPEDCIGKLKYYLEHTVERKAIADAGKKKVQEDYSPYKFWTNIFSSLSNAVDNFNWDSYG